MITAKFILALYKFYLLFIIIISTHVMKEHNLKVYAHTDPSVYQCLATLNQPTYFVHLPLVDSHLLYADQTALICHPGLRVTSRGT